MADRRPISDTKHRHESVRDQRPAVPFGDLMRRFRIAAGFTQEALAARATISERAVSDLERGERRRPQRETLRLLADALDLVGEDRALFEATALAHYATPPRLVPRDTPPHNLPLSPTPLVGREGDLAAIAALLSQPTTRLVTVTGGGGVGKTRIALDAVAFLSFPDGIFFVPLAALRDPALVLSVIAQSLGLAERGPQGVRESLVAYLGRKRLLLVLDNFEHLIPAAVLIADLLAICGALKILVTSRAALHLRGEHEYRLRPLALPDPRDADDMERVRRSPAVELFMQRAMAVNRDFVLTPTNTRAIVDLCTRLDGLPLALELAAARTSVLPLAELLARLEHRFSVLTDGAHDLPERQQTMRRAIDWSYDLLTTDEQRLFRRLAAFAGGCTLEAAESVGGALSNCPFNLLSGLSSLVDKSLVQADVGADATRFTMLETVREYGLERLEEAGEEEARCALAAYFLALATVEPGIVGAARAGWLARLDAEHENIRAALTWARDRDEAEAGLRLAAALWQFWFTRGHLREGRAWIEAMLALDHTGAAAPFARAEALCGSATLALRQGDIPAAERYARESLAVCGAMDDARGMAAALNLLGNAAFERNDYAEAVTHYMASLALCREIGNRLGISVSLGNLGRTARFQGDYVRALRYYQESETLDREIGYVEGLANVLGNQGHMARDCGDPSGALPLIEESLTLYEQMGQKRGAGIALAQLAMIAHDTGDHTSARTYVERSMAIRQQIGDQWGIAQSLTILGDISYAAGDGGHAWPCYRDALMISHAIGNELGVVECLERLAGLMAGRRMWTNAARCFGAASAVRERIHAPILPVNRPAVDRVVADARAALGDDLFVATCDAGRVLDTDEMIAEATRRPSPNGALRAE